MDKWKKKVKKEGFVFHIYQKQVLDFDFLKSFTELFYRYLWVSQVFYE